MVATGPQKNDRTEPGWNGKSPTGTPWSPGPISIGSRDSSDSSPAMDGPPIRPESGPSPEPNHLPQQVPTPTSTPTAAPSPAAAGLPGAISFRQLEALRLSAIEADRGASPADSSADAPISGPLQGPNRGPGPGADLAELEQLLGAYEQVGQRLLLQLGRQGSALEQHRHPQQVMALGALGAHIRLGLQALAASRP